MILHHAPFLCGSYYHLHSPNGKLRHRKLNDLSKIPQPRTQEDWLYCLIYYTCILLKLDVSYCYQGLPLDGYQAKRHSQTKE